MKRSALLHLVATPKQKQEMHSPGCLASLLKLPGAQIVLFGDVTTKIVSGTANSRPRIFKASQLYAP